MNNKKLNEARLYAGLSISEVCKWLGRSERTYQYWAQYGAPEYVYPLLELLGGDLSAFGWHGWRIVNGELYAPDLIRGWTPNDILAAWWDKQRLAALDRERRNNVAAPALTSSAERVKAEPLRGRASASLDPNEPHTSPTRNRQRVSDG